MALIEENNNVIKEERTPGCYVKQRYVLALMAFLGLCNVSCLRNNVNVAILAMVNTTHGNSTHTGPLNWDSKQEGFFLGAYYYGYMSTNLLGGWMVTKYGFRKVFGWSILLSAVFGIATPAAAYMSFYLAVACRVLTGLLQGAVIPAVTLVWASWAPIYERSILVSFSFTGILFGFIIIFPLAGFITEYLAWEAVFYVTGGAAIFWSVLFFIYVSDTPSLSKRISEEERSFLKKTTGNFEKTNSKPVIPWKAMMTAKCSWALFSIHFADAWFQYTLAAVLPTYLVDVFHFHISQSGLAMVLPFILQLFVALAGGHVTDLFRKRRWLTTTNARKLNSFLAVFLSGALTVAMGYVGRDHVTIVTMFTISFAISGLTYPGYLSSGLDVAPRYAGVLMGISNTMANTSGFLGPLTAGYLVVDKLNLKQWQMLFWITFGISTFGATMFAVFGSGEEQKWAKDDYQCEDAKDEDQEALKPQTA